MMCSEKNYFEKQIVRHVILTVTSHFTEDFEKQL